MQTLIHTVSQLSALDQIVGLSMVVVPAVLLVVTLATAIVVFFADDSNAPHGQSRRERPDRSSFANRTMSRRLLTENEQDAQRAPANGQPPVPLACMDSPHEPFQSRRYHRLSRGRWLPTRPTDH